MAVDLSVIIDYTYDRQARQCCWPLVFGLGPLSSLRINILGASEPGPNISTGLADPCGFKEEVGIQSEKLGRSNAFQ